jgi:hypothetical protein
MSQSNSFFATKDDFPQTIEILDHYKHTTLSGKKLAIDDFINHDKITIVFPDFGEIALWPDSIDLSQYPENSLRWKSAVLAKIGQKNNPGKGGVEVKVSAISKGI